MLALDERSMTPICTCMMIPNKRSLNLATITTICLCVWLALRQLLQRLIIASIGISALCAVNSCSSQRHLRVTMDSLTSRTTSESMSHKVLVKTTMAALPSESSTMTLPLTALHNLPESLPISRQTGRARIEYRKIKDTVYLTAHCDSIERAIEQMMLIEQGSQTNSSIGQVSKRQEKLSSQQLYSPIYSVCIIFIAFAGGFLLATLLGLTRWYHQLLNSLIRAIRRLF